MKRVNKFSKWSKYKKPSILETYIIEICVIISGLILIHIFLFANAFSGDTINADIASKFGSFIGGYAGSILALISVLLLFATLKRQNASFKIDKFENRFFDLLKIHRDNVSELSIGSNKGKGIFVLLLREFRATLSLIRKIINVEGINFDKKQIINISYLVFFYGLGHNSTRILKGTLEKFDKSTIDRLVAQLENYTKTDEIKNKFGNTFLEGQQSRLGHYFRHLYQTITFVHFSELDIDKYEYIKTMRAQLSNHEQALLFFNSLSDLGKTWNEEQLIEEYRLINNLPKGFIDPIEEIDLKNIFSDLVFEYEE